MWCETSTWPASTLAQTDAFSGWASWGTSLLSVVWLGHLWHQTQLFFCFFLTFAKLKQEVLDLRGSNSCRMTGGWTDGWNAATETWLLDLHFATEDSDSCTGSQFRAPKVFCMRMKKTQLLTREFPQLSQRCPQSKIETDCSISEENLKSLSGVWIIGHDSSCVLGGPSERSNVCRWRPIRVQGPESVANHMLGLGAIYLREKQEHEFKTKPVASVLVTAWLNRPSHFHPQSTDDLWGMMNTMR